MEVDSSTKVSIMDEGTCRRLFHKQMPKLAESPYILRDYNKRPVNVMGMFNAPITYGSFEGNLPLLVIKEKRHSLLGLNWFAALGIKLDGILCVDATSVESVLAEFPEVFEEGLGTFKGHRVSLHLDPNMKPIQLKARNIPFALRSKVEQEIDRLVKQGVLVPVKFTEWATPVVPVLKSNGQIRLCGDYKCTLNKAVCQDPYPVPAINRLLAELTGGRHFAKLDLSQAYLQLVVDASAKAQTIVTHRRAFKCTCLQFSVHSSWHFSTLHRDAFRKCSGSYPIL